MAEQLLKCAACSKTYRAPKYDENRAYACPRCSQPLEPVSRLGTPQPEAAADARTDDDPLVGQEIGQYRILEKLGEGGMGAVYKAEHVGLRKIRALKVLPEYLAKRSPKAVGRFTREAQAAAALEHPNVVRIHTVGEAGGLHFIDMEFVEGETAQDRLRREGRLSVDEATRIVLDTAKALAAAHAKNIVHRDIKPANILLDRDGNVKVADFGLAKDIEDDTLITEEGKGGLGTVQFMSPEQTENAQVDGRSDIYSLGCTYYYLLTAELPFKGDSHIAVALAHRTDPVPDPSSVVPSLPKSVCKIVKKAMAKKPEGRYQTCEEMIEALSAMTQDREGDLHQSGPGAALRGGLARGIERMAPVARTLNGIPKPVLWAAVLALPACLILWGTTNSAPTPSTPKVVRRPGPKPSEDRKEAARRQRHSVPEPTAPAKPPAAPEGKELGNATAGQAAPKPEPGYAGELGLVTEYLTQAQALRQTTRFSDALDRLRKADDLLAKLEAKGVARAAGQRALVHQSVISVRLAAQARSSTNLKQIGLAVHMYAADHNELPAKGEFPQALLPYVMGNKGVFYHPMNAEKPQDAFPQNVDYEFADDLPKRMMMIRDPSKTRMAWEAEALGGSRLVLFCDGRVGVVEETEATAHRDGASLKPADAQAGSAGPYSQAIPARTLGPVDAGKLPPGFERAFMLPDSDEDQYGNPVHVRIGRKADPATGYPYEIWLKRPRLEFVFAPAGEFVMGSNSGSSGQKPVHKVRLTKPFYLAKYEVTQGQWQAVMSNRPWGGMGRVKSNSRNPVVYVSRADFQRFMAKLDSRLRLPTEAEWEYACRAGSRSKFFFGDDESKLGEYAWYKGNVMATGERYGHAVGTKRPNAWGLYDILGNVWEACQDWEGPYGSGTQTDPRGPVSGSSRVIRGGSFEDPAKYSRWARAFASANRGRFRDDARFCNLGFRPAISLPDAANTK